MSQQANPMLSFLANLGLDIKVFESKWTEKCRAIFPAETHNLFTEIVVEQGQYGPSAHFKGSDFHFYLGISDYSTIAVGEVLNISQLELIILEKDDKKIGRICKVGECRK
jgi:hypothetical protein